MQGVDVAQEALGLLHFRQQLLDVGAGTDLGVLGAGSQLEATWPPARSPGQRQAATSTCLTLNLARGLAHARGRAPKPAVSDRQHWPAALRQVKGCLTLKL